MRASVIGGVLVIAWPDVITMVVPLGLMSCATEGRLIVALTCGKRRERTMLQSLRLIMSARKDDELDQALLLCANIAALRSFVNELGAPVTNRWVVAVPVLSTEKMGRVDTLLL